jgi:transcriptional regulator with XRE-family HTH domain
MNIAKNIKKFRELRNLSQKHMADKLDITQQNYSKMESGEVDFPISRLFTIAEILSVRATDILSFDEKVVFNTTQNEFKEGAVGIQQGLTISQELQKQYEARISSLENEITRLHTILDKALNK